MAPVTVSVAPAMELNVPPPALRVIARDNVMVLVVCSVPPPKESVPAAAPRLPLLEIARVPPFTAQFVVAAVVPARV